MNLKDKIMKIVGSDLNHAQSKLCEIVDLFDNFKTPKHAVTVTVSNGVQEETWQVAAFDDLAQAQIFRDKAERDEESREVVSWDVEDYYPITPPPHNPNYEKWALEHKRSKEKRMDSQSLG